MTKKQPAPPAANARLHKHLAALGLGSRRLLETWIAQGKIRVDGRVAKLGDRVGARSRISIDGRPLRARAPARPRVLLYHKPEGEISTRSDPRGRPTVFRHLPKLRGARWVAVGRLDLNTRGLLLFTDDGELANRLMHPSFGVEREYMCRVYGDVDEAALARLRAGLRIGGELLRFDRVRRGRGDGRNAWFSVVVTQGRYREIRRLWEAAGCRLSRLIRVRYGGIELPRNLPPGKWRELPAAAAAKLARGAE
ncbi:MAG: pseudouridine synthase [Gammaproteobacteria bacterium]|nr:pseudouridine synthase [Gammaproteobacteria bacterium]CAJ2375986.1 MAG: Ribosomal large subunit pseudouridine synthase B [Arenicellales bacterium IbO2]MDA7962127.1 pseudouridine synthase [Gammaproteobacteria bacterium]MDA7969652.1 pseudouridine synthase [Gammaproteobacteria bacterium]MDA7971287.1 pseudouridine synthase [Gammaproteobacteria bacterium]